MQKRKFDELISHFNCKVSEMSIDQKYKMELLCMISAIGLAHEKELSTNLAEVGTDLISRQAAIDYFVLNVGFHDEDGYPIEDTDELRKIWTEYFDGIPSAQPKKIRGQWSIKGQAIDTVRGYWAKCSACGHSVFGGGNYCSNCGSYNKGEVTT